MKRISTVVMAGVLGAGLVLKAFTAPAALTEAPIEQSVESAKTKANHEAIAAHYEQEAAALREKAEEHARLAFLYARGQEGANGDGERLAEHCEGIAEKVRAAAEESIELAILHRDLAAQAAE